MSSGRELIWVYGPPGSGKSSIGREIAHRLSVPFWDVDEQIQSGSGASIPEIFAREGETGFRSRESQVIAELSSHTSGVIALGGGALLAEENRFRVESSGRVIFLEVPFATLLERVQREGYARPLVTGDLAARLEALLSSRREHYASFPLRLDASSPVEQVALDALVRLGAFHVRGMGDGYDVRVEKGGLSQLGEKLASRGLRGPLVLISDENVAVRYAEQALASLRLAGYEASLLTIPAGEAYKTIQTVNQIWDGLLAARMERSSTVLALGGGVVGDMAGFAAAAYLRGVGWVVLPTSLLAMVDASVGGKTAIDLPQGKNLVGAFHSPRLVLADPEVLATLPEAELRSGLAEVIKAGVIADAALFALCEGGWQSLQGKMDELVRRAMAVKISVIEADPYEQGVRASLNLGHTFGHAVELVSAYRLRHGEAVSIGLVAEARLAEHLGIAQSGLADQISKTSIGLGLPVAVPAELDHQAILKAMQVDKKRLAGSVRFALPIRIGEVRVGIEADLQDKAVRDSLFNMAG